MLFDTAAGKIVRTLDPPAGSLRLESPPCCTHLFYLREHPGQAALRPSWNATLSAPRRNCAAVPACCRAGGCSPWRRSPARSRARSLSRAWNPDPGASQQSPLAAKRRLSSAMTSPPASGTGLTGKWLRDIRSPGAVQRLLCSADGKALYVFTAEEWSAHRVADGQHLWSQPLLWKDIYRITPDPAVGQIAVSMVDGTIAFHRLRDGHCTGRLTGHATAAGECGWSPDGTRLFSATGLGEISIWHVPTARELVTLVRVGGLSHSLQVTGDGQRLLFGDYGSFWTAPP